MCLSHPYPDWRCDDASLVEATPTWDLRWAGATLIGESKHGTRPPARGKAEWGAASDAVAPYREAKLLDGAYPKATCRPAAPRRHPRTDTWWTTSIFKASAPDRRELDFLVGPREAWGQELGMTARLRRG